MVFNIRSRTLPSTYLEKKVLLISPVDLTVTKAQAAAEDSKDFNLVKLSLEGAPLKPLALKDILANLASLESELISNN